MRSFKFFKKSFRQPVVLISLASISTILNFRFFVKMESIWMQIPKMIQKPFILYNFNFLIKIQYFS